MLACLLVALATAIKPKLTLYDSESRLALPQAVVFPMRKRDGKSSSVAEQQSSKADASNLPIEGLP